jgi:hypothetical protein
VTLYVEENLSETVPVSVKEKRYTGKTLVKYMYRFGNQTFCVKNPMKRFHKSYKYDIMCTVFEQKSFQPFNFTVQKRVYEYREYQWYTKKRNKKELKQAGGEIYQRRIRTISDAGCEITSRAAKLRKKSGDTWVLEGKLGFLCRTATKKYIAESEWQVEKETEGKEKADGES